MCIWDVNFSVDELVIQKNGQADNIESDAARHDLLGVVNHALFELELIMSKD